MELTLQIIQFIFYAILIVLVSKYLLVGTLTKIGKLLKLTPKAIGNIAGVSTSIPELLTVSLSAFTGLITTSTYNVLSSNIINLTQYGIVTILKNNQKKLKNKAIKIDLILVTITIIIPILMMFFKVENNILIVPIFIVFLFVFYRITNNSHKLYIKKKKEITIQQKDNEKENNIQIKKYTTKSILKVVSQFSILFIIGIILYFIGNMLSDILNILCRRFNVPEIILGTLLGLITSIPELITFLEAQSKQEINQEGIVEATGNLLTSNIVNLFVIQSIGIIIFNIFT